MSTPATARPCFFAALMAVICAFVVRHDGAAAIAYGACLGAVVGYSLTTQPEAGK